MSLRRRARAYRVLYFSSVVATTVGVVLGATPESWYEGKAPTVYTLIGPIWRVLLLILAGITILVQNIVASYSIRTRSMRIVENLLRVHHGDVFGNEKEDRAINRITLFEYRRCWWPWRIYEDSRTQATAGRLVPVLRHGQHTSHISSFTVHDPPSRRTGCHGVAGEAWLGGGTASSQNLESVSSESTDEELSRYAQRTFVTPDFVERRIERNRPMSRSMYAVVVKVDTERWGVLVADSTDPAKFSRHTMKKVDRFVSELLETILSGDSR